MARRRLVDGFAILVTLFSLALLTPAFAGSGPKAVADAKAALVTLRTPLSKVAALNLALEHNGDIRKAQKDVEATAGVAVQTTAIIFPQITHTANYTVNQDSLIESNQNLNIATTTIPFPAPIGPVSFGGGTTAKINNQSWTGEIRLVQSIYEGGRLLSSLRRAKLLNQQAELQFQSTVADTLLDVSTAYDDVLRNAQRVEVRRVALQFLRAYLDDTTTRYNAGAIPEFDVLRQEVEVANAVANHVRAIGDYRVAKQQLVLLLGYNLPNTVGDDLPLRLTTSLSAQPYRETLASALAEGERNRTEIAALEKEERLQDESIITAKAGLKPSVQAFAGYELTSRVQTRNAGDYLYGGLAGAQVSWPLFDGFLTQGKVREAVAQRERASEAKADTTRQVAQQVRQAWSDLRTARAVLDAQTKNIEQGQRSLELAQERYKAGAGTQIDVLDAQSALTEARGNYVDALHDYSVARARLVRATGEWLAEPPPQPKPATR